MSAESIEIAVVLEDSVLAVEHIASPRTSRRATWALAGAALLGALLFAGLAIHAVAVAGENQAAARAWALAGGESWDFHPRRLHPASDLAAVISLGSALGCGVWALLRARRERSRFVVGRGRGVDFALDVPDTVLVAPAADGFTFTPAPGMTLPAGPIARGTMLRASLGATTFMISSVAAPRATALTRAVDRRALGYAGLSAAAHAVLIALFFLIPAEGNGFIVDDLGALRRRTRIEFKPRENPLVEPGEGGGAMPGGASAPAETGPRGALGTQEATAADRRGKIKRTADEPTLARASDEDHHAARTAGILGVVRAQRAQLTAFTSMSDFSSGLEDEDIRGGWRGDELGDSRGFGTHISGDGPGGGGQKLYATIGVGPRRSGPFGGPPGIGPGLLPTRRPEPTFSIGTPTVPEGIDRNMIRRYVRQKHAQITHCYERQLIATPGVAGTATTAFTIDANGRVITARAAGLGVAAVERCLEEVLRSIQFPAGGGIVNVTSYPFTFHRVGD